MIYLNKINQLLKCGVIVLIKTKKGENVNISQPINSSYHLDANKNNRPGGLIRSTVRVRVLEEFKRTLSSSSSFNRYTFSCEKVIIWRRPRSTRINFGIHVIYSTERHLTGDSKSSMLKFRLQIPEYSYMYRLRLLGRILFSCRRGCVSLMR